MEEALDITSEGLKQKGYNLSVEGGPTPTIVISFNGLHLRCGIYKKDWNKAIKQIERKLDDRGFEQIIISEIETCLSTNHKVLMGNSSNRKTSSSSIPLLQQQQDAFVRMAPKASKSNDSMEEWRFKQKASYDDLRNTTNEQVPGLWLPLEFTISIRCILNIENITLPFIGIILGPPSSYKSVAVDLPKDARETFYTDNFSPKAFVSHNSNLTEEELQEQDLLPKMKNKMFLYQS